MRPPKDELEATAHFRERYGRPQPDVMRRRERFLLGTDWGACGYTTLEHADVIAETLDLRPSHALLDVGAGRGWPGLYLAKVSGCRVVLSDLPMEGLREGVTRARVEKMEGRANAVAASARRLPFRPQAFDAIVHTDVLC